ncbi:MAG: cupin domain-containing protein [Candidatus Omnitrophica bacterium]|nr:cupin domain-containing protein [Candidatus Omnitrophota bacterium]
MAISKEKMLIPRSIRLESSTICQLDCPSCPTALGQIAKNLGKGFLSFRSFKEIVDSNPWIISIELSNWGEIFLNKDLLKIMKYAYKNNIALHAGNGVNLNNAAEDDLEGLVKYKFRDISCSIDGVSQGTYSLYRKNGDFNGVIENIKAINHFKNLYNSEYPVLKWKFIIFGHNEQEISKARQMAEDLNMSFHVKLAWEGLYSGESFSPVNNKELVRKETGLGVADRSEFREKYGYEYTLRDCCLELWRTPQINFNGRVLGCTVNYHNGFGDTFKDGLIAALNNERINYARAMLLGKNEPREDIPCSFCRSYDTRKKNNDWVSESEIEGLYLNAFDVILRRAVFGNYAGSKIYRLLRRVKQRLGPVLAARSGSKRGLSSLVYHLNVPFVPDTQTGWQAYPVFRGKTKKLQKFSCHTSVLTNGSCPHPPHAHLEEEVLLMLSGEAEIILPELDPGKRTMLLKRGEFVYYPGNFPHTIRTVSQVPANYLMFKWSNEKGQRPVLKFGRFDISENRASLQKELSFRTQTKFDAPTAFLRRLHCHISTLAPGASYERHCDTYDVAVVLFEGNVETLGKLASPDSVIFYGAGELHGMRNPSDITARYAVFEFR